MSEEAEPKTEVWSFSADRPIPGRKDDKFQRASFADALVTQVLALPKNDSFVLGLVGAWGSGKTSILSMVEEAMQKQQQDVVVLKFNPWLFSGTEQLAAHFFHEIAAQLQESTDRKLQEAGASLMSYSEALSPLSAVPFIGKWAEKIASGFKAAGEALKRQGGALPTSVTSQRKAITKLLGEQDKRLLVIVDDLDRLPKADVGELFKLVRLTADFPNTTYLLAFDRPRVEAALGETEGEGRAYLEKILQVTFDVPVLRGPDLTTFLLTEIQAAVGDRKHGPFDQDEWTNVFHLAIRPLFDTPRDVRRFTNAIPVALSVIGEEIAVVDVLAIEAVRSLVPDVWARLYGAKDLLTGTEERTFHAANRGERERAQFEELLKAAGEHRDAIQQLLSRVFPPCRRFIDNHHYGAEWRKRWRKARRLVHPDILQFYFEKSLPPELLRGQVVQDIYEKLGNEEAFRSAISGFEPSIVEHVLSRLEDYEDDFPASVVEPALVVVYEQYPRLREGRAGFSDFGASMTVSRIALRLLRRVTDESQRAAIVSRVFARMGTLSERYRLVSLIERRDRHEDRLVSPSEAAQLAEALQTQTLGASSDSMAKERDLVLLLQFCDDGTDHVPDLVRTWATSDRFMLRLLRSAVGDRTGFGLGDVAQKHEYTIAWEYLVDLLGETLLVSRVDGLHSARSSLHLEEREVVALDTAVRYRAGVRPSRFLQDDDEDVVVEEDEDEDTPRKSEQPSPEARAEERLYGSNTLIHLLASVVPARRLVARNCVGHMLDNAVTVPDKVVARLVDTSADGEVQSAERAAAIDLVRRTGLEWKLFAPLTTQWFTAASVTAEISQRIAGLYHEHPDRASELLDALERVPLETMTTEHVRDGILAISYLFHHHAADLQEADAARAVKTIERFANVEVLRAAVEHARSAQAGERA